MSYTIYGLCLRGSPEVRYVGLTSSTPEARLARLTLEARLYGRRPTEGRAGWLLDNEGNIEALALASAATKREAHAKEREIANLCLRLDHRLLNHWLVPVERRVSWEPSPFRQRKAVA